MEIKIREARKDDMAKVLALITELAVFEKEPNAVKIDEQELIRAGFGTTPAFRCFVAEVNAAIVGMALVYFRYSTWNGKTVHLEDLIVTEQMRGKGIGQALYQKVMQFANAEDAKRVSWVVLDWNKDAIKFYEKTGAKMYKNWYLVHMDEPGIKKFVN